MRIGIFFGGKSREREVSFAGGRTVYDLLDKSLFTPIPIFLDSIGNFILLDWEFLYKGTIRDFYPDSAITSYLDSNFQYYIEHLGELSAEKQLEIIQKVGKKIQPEEFSSLFDFAFLALHGPYGEDGSIQGIFEYYQIPYSGSGTFASSVGIDKSLQKSLMQQSGFLTTKSITIKRNEWFDNAVFRHRYLESIHELFGNKPVVIKPASQGSSIGISILKEYDISTLQKSIYSAFFRVEIELEDWKNKTEKEKIQFIHELSDINQGIGLPAISGGKVIHSAPELLRFLEILENFISGKVILEAIETEHSVLVEEFIQGREFSCIAIEDDMGKPIALPPTEIIKKQDLFNYRAKYLPGISRKVTPIDLPDEEIRNIRFEVEKLYTQLRFDVYARIDGIYSKDNQIYLNDPNTTSGMMPSSFFFHQAAEIGLSPGQFLTYIIYTSLKSRLKKSFNSHKIERFLHSMNQKLELKKEGKDGRIKIAVIFGGNSSERHISVESGRNVFEKLSSSLIYQPVPFFLEYYGNPEEMTFHQLPFNLMLKDNADDILFKSKHFEQKPIIKQILEESKYISQKFGNSDYNFFPSSFNLETLSKEYQGVFIALHGRPGEDGTIQKQLEKYGLAFNGSGIVSSSTTIDKYITNENLAKYGLLTPKHILINKSDFDLKRGDVIQNIENKIPYPLIAKPSDDGCSSAVKKIDNRAELLQYMELIFRLENVLSLEVRKEFHLTEDEEFPQKQYFVVEELIQANGADHFIEITGGMLTKYSSDGQLQYEVFEPSEALASKGILSLEEKFLAGEGLNITPARFSADMILNKKVSTEAKAEFEKAAMILGVEGYCRIDAFVRVFKDKPSETVFIEVNSLPGLTPATCIFHQAAINEYKPSEFLEQILHFGFLKNKKEQSSIAN